jgi:hypothetical protein
MPTPLPSVQLAPFKTGTETVVLTPGLDADEDLLALVPLVEPGTVGPPPIAPSLVAKLDQPAPWPVARRRCGSGELITAPLDARNVRPRTRGWRLVWEALTQEQKNTLMEWLVGEVGISLQSMSVEVDGEGAGGLTVGRIRPTERPKVEWLGMRRLGVPGGQVIAGVWSVELVGEEIV